MEDEDADRQPVTEVLEGVEEAAQDGRVTVEEVMIEAGQRSFGPFILALGLISFSPVDAIPGVSAVLGAIIMLMAGQMLLNRDTPWLPARVRNMGISASRAQRAVDKLKPLGARLERFVKPRWEILAGRTGSTAAAVACILNALILIPLEVVPGATSIPGAAVTVLGLALTTRDGLLMAVGLIGTAAALGMSVYLLFA